MGEKLKEDKGLRGIKYQCDKKKVPKDRGESQ